MKARRISCWLGMLWFTATLIGIAEKGSTDTTPSSTPFVGGVFRALVIANSDYKDPEGMWTPLKTPIRDAETVVQMLQKRYGFRPENVELLKNASRAEILSAMSKMAKSAQENDSVFIYYAGHGYLDQDTKEAFWIPVDGVGREDYTYVAVSTVKTKLSVIADRVKHVFLISDSCFSGALLREGHRGIKATEKTDQYYQKVARKKSVQILAAGGLEYVDDSYKGTGHSPFTYYLLKHLEQNPDRYVSATELSLEVTKAVSKNVYQTPEKGVLHGAGDNNGEFFFVNARALASLEKAPVISGGPSRGTPAVDAEAEMWALIKDTNSVQDVRSFLQSFPQGRLAPVARLKLQQLERVAHRGTQTRQATDAKGPSSLPASGAKLALFPGSFENDGKRAYAKALDMVEEVLRKSGIFSQIQSYYPFKDSRHIQKISKDLNPELLWKKGGLFSLPEPDTEEVCKEARALGVDAVLMYYVDVKKRDSRIVVYAIDVNAKKMHTAKETSIQWRLDGGHATKSLTEQVIHEYQKQK
ncbi:MAG: caspase family protein [Deltaproteobacteria bacterium]|nr:caspase family protein [Deltaproteobacteria bacterium]